MMTLPGLLNRQRDLLRIYGFVDALLRDIKEPTFAFDADKLTAFTDGRDCRGARAA